MIILPRQRKPNRLRHYDYSQNGWYFITICTKEREEYFGKIQQGKMIMTNLGAIVLDLWLEIPKHFNMVSLDEYIVMPNHIHGIIVIDKNNLIVGNADLRSLQTKIKTKNIRTKMLLSKIIHGFKSSVSRKINQTIWQRSFYDNIIRNEQSLCAIREYIRSNPLKWNEDEKNNTIVKKNA